MIAYLIKLTLCSGLLLAAYHLFLEKEKMHKFNRFYLLFSIVLSFIIPLITISIESVPVIEKVYPVINIIPGQASEPAPVAAIQPVHIPDKVNLWPFVEAGIYSLYCLITIALLLRFARTIYRINRKTSGNNWIRYKNVKLVLLKEKLSTHTFLNTVFVSNNDYSGQEIEKEILTHELAHVEQKHSLDILFIEIVRSIIWINPFFILYKKAIQLNHEFLADDVVIDTYKNIPGYQHLLLDKISQYSSNNLSSRLNFLITKKRLTMMKQKKNKPRAAFKTILAVALCACSFFIFTDKIQAQTKPAANPEPVRQRNIPPQMIQDSAKKKIYTTKGPLIVKFHKPGEPVELDWKPDKSGKQTGKVHGKGVSQEKFDEYEKAVVSAYKPETIFDTLQGYRVDIQGLDIKYLRSIYESMTKEQQSNATPIWGYIPKTLPPAKNPPTATQLEEWQNKVKFGVWIDGKKVDNKILTNYKPSDFANTFVSYVYPNARKHGHIYQVDLATPAYFKKTWAEYDL